MAHADARIRIQDGTPAPAPGDDCIPSLRPCLEGLRTTLRLAVESAPNYPLDESTYKQVPTKVAGVYIIFEATEVRYVGKGWPLRGRVWAHGRVRRISAPTTFQGSV